MIRPLLRPTATATATAKSILFVVGIALILAAAWFGLRIYSQQDGNFNEEYPFSLAPEFPSANDLDEERITSAAAAFLAVPEWSDVTADWQIVDTAVLTRGGVRTGIYGEVRFDSLVSLPGPLGFVRCDSIEYWERDKDAAFNIGGLQIWLFDGTEVPYQVLPLNSDGLLPTQQDIREFTSGFTECAGTPP